MKHINYKQLAFVLDIEPIEAVRKIIFVHCKVNNEKTPTLMHTVRDYINKFSPYPAEFDIDLLAHHLNIPGLRYAISDIHENYMKRQGTKKYILCDFPEKELKTKLREHIKIPSVLASILKPEDVELIKTEWNERYGITFGKLNERP